MRFLMMLRVRALAVLIWLAVSVQLSGVSMVFTDCHQADHRDAHALAVGDACASTCELLDVDSGGVDTDRHTIAHPPMRASTLPLLVQVHPPLITNSTPPPSRAPPVG